MGSLNRNSSDGLHPTPIRFAPCSCGWRAAAWWHARDIPPTAAHSVTLTRKGRQVYDRLWADSEPVRQRLLAALRPDEADTLVEFLNRISETMARAATSAIGNDL